jgi:uncharacterized protein
MRLNQKLVDRIAHRIANHLLKSGLIIWEEPAEKLAAAINSAITKELMIEDQLNEEIKTLLESKTQDYERSMMDYGRVFQMVKSKLVRERGLIL